jgi:signal transduction histidine kinase
VGVIGRVLKQLRDPDLKTKLLAMMLSLLLLSVSSLFMLHLYSERQLLSHVRDYTWDLSTTIDIAQQQPAAEGDPQVVLRAYAEKLKKLGVKDVSIGLEDEVLASTNPQLVGKHLLRSKRKGTHEYVIKGVLGEETGPPGSQKTSTFTIPLLVGDRRVGVLLITRYLDDFSALSRQALLHRLAVTLAVFALGIIVSLYLSWSFSRPLQGLTHAAQLVAAGDLSVQVPVRGGDEIGGLSKTFNEMVQRLRENRVLEERLHFAERSTAVGRLASAVAHEIRNPLNFINLSIDHVRERLAPEDPGRRVDFDRILGSMKAEISRLNRLVGDFLSFGKPMRLDRRPCAIGEVVQEVASLVEHKARDQGIVLSVEADPDLPRVVADAELLKTCFLNLMINAVDAMPSGGLLNLSVHRGVSDEGGGAVVVSVSDTGQGMTPEDIKTAFEPYFSTKEAGLGLGLALTQKIVGDHGGTIALESAPGNGTTARIVLPLSHAAQPARFGEAVVR